MIEQDTIKLLRECDAGVKMGVSSIDEVLDHVRIRVFGKRCTTARKSMKSWITSWKACCSATMTRARIPILLPRACPG